MSKARKDGSRRMEDGIRKYHGKRGITYNVVLTDRDGVKRSKAFKTRAEAIEARDRNRVALRDGSYVPPSDKTVSQYVDAWIERLDVKASTRMNYESALQHIRIALGDRKLQKLTKLHVESFVRNMQSIPRPGRPPRPVAIGTKVAVLRLLKTLLEDAAEDGLLPANPCRKVKRPKSDDSTYRDELRDGEFYERGRHVLRKADVEEMLDHMKAQNYAVWLPCFLMWHTGLRRGEALALRWSRIRLDAKPARISVEATEWRGRVTTPKTTRSRAAVEISSYVADVLRQHRAVQASDVQTLTGQGASADWFVCALPDSVTAPQKGSSFTSRMARTLKGTRFEQVTPHCLRHAHGSHLISLGWTVPEVARRLRDTQATVMSVYAHAIESGRSLDDDFRPTAPAAIPEVAESGKTPAFAPLRAVK